MADRRIIDFPQAADVQDDDYILIYANDDTYRIPVSKLKEAVEEIASRAETTSNSAKNQAADAQAKAASAEVAASNAESDAAAAMQKADDLEKEHDAMNTDIASRVDGAYVENGYLYLTAGDEVVAGPLGPFSGSGGGTGSDGSGYMVSLKNLLPSRVLTASGDSPVFLSVMYTSADEDGNDDGDGIGTITVNGARVSTLSVPQGVEYKPDVSPYLVSGTNTVKFKVENSEGQSRTLTYTVTVVSLTMETTFDDMGIYTGAIVFNYTVTGSGTKTIRFLMDGEEYGSEEVSSSGRSRSYAIAEQPPGEHILAAYAEVTVDGTTVRSNTLTIGMMWVSGTMSGPAVMSTFVKTSAVQGETLGIPFMAYDPTSETATVTLSVIANGSVYSEFIRTVDRSSQLWSIQDYPVGAVVFRIDCSNAAGNAIKDIAVAVTASDIEVEPVTDALALYFDPVGRSNMEDAPASWSDGNVTATFAGIGFSHADGWLTDADGTYILRILPGGEMTIPFKLFESDARDAGATIEVEMATHNVRDYDTVVMSCMSGGRGFKIASQFAEMRSEQKQVSMQFKEDKKVRISFVVEPRNLFRRIFIYVDGVMCGVKQYATNDNFAQSPAVGITIGAESAGIDIYKIRVYTKGLTRRETLDNYIFDRPMLSDRVDAAKRNNIYDIADNIVISKLPSTLPYMILRCDELPQSKEEDDKLCIVEYINPSDASRNFTATAWIAVQGTSSAGYKKKNFKIKLKNGIVYTVSGEAAEMYLLREDSMPATIFCMKADVASSEGSNNVELARLYNEIVPYKTPAQQANEKVRVGIDGLPCVVFWNNTASQETTFWGKYNFNFDKDAEVYGLTAGCESWEIRNNTSNRVLFKSADFTSLDSEGKYAWLNDFEGRYPKKNTDCTNLKAMCEWVVSTDRSAVSSEDEKAARLQKFKDEFEDHFIKAPMLFYYLFTETFLMVDSRAKNFFPTSFDGTHWFPFPYDFDTALGINNEGQLVFDYDLEDTDFVNGAEVFNGQDSVLWCNIRDAFPDEIKEMYVTLRTSSGSIFNYKDILYRFTSHQKVWPEAVWNEDAWEKYLEPLENDNSAFYLPMLQGDKDSQRDWWLFNGFRYRDSKYQCGDASEKFITLRCYKIGDITVTPYSHIWVRIKYGSYTVTQRAKRNIPVTLKNPTDVLKDTETYIYSADRLSDIGDLSHVNVGYADFSPAVKLQRLKLGNGADTYKNTMLNELYVGNNELLSYLDVQNCSALTTSIDLSGCVSLETIKAKGSSVSSFTLPVGGKLKTMELPSTITNLTIRDMAQFTSLTMTEVEIETASENGAETVTTQVPVWSRLNTLRVENTPNIPLETIINSATNLDRVRLVGMEWDAESEATLQISITRLKSCIGLDATDGNIEKAVVTGKVYVPSISAALLTEINEAFPQLVVVANGVPQYVVRYLDWDNTVLYRAVVAEGDNAVNAVTAGYISAPTKAGTEDTTYVFKDFGSLPTDIHSNVTVVAQYVTTYRVRFMVDGTAYNTQWIVAGGSATTPSSNPSKASTAQYSYTFSRWSGNYTNISGPVDVTAVFTSTTRTYTVYFYVENTLWDTVENVPYGGTATPTAGTPVDPSGDGAEFDGWSPSNTNIQGTTTCKAQFASACEVVEISDSWDDILASISAGTYKSKYKVGNYKPLDLGTEGVVNMQIAAFDKEPLADGSGVAAISWISKELLTTRQRMNPALVGKQTGIGFDPAAAYSWTAVDGVTNKYESTNKGKGNTTSSGCWKITSSTAGTFTIAYTQSGESGYDYMDLYVNGVSEFAGKSKGQDASGSYETALSPGTEVVVLATFRKDGSSDNGDDKGTVTFSSDVPFEIIVPTTTVVIKEAVPAQEGTGSIGGWEKTEMRAYLKNTVKPLIPENVRNAIKEVTKTHPAYDTNESSFTQTTADDVWLPNYTEIFGSSRPYKALFPDDASRIKSKVGATSASWWWLRSASNGYGFDLVNTSGSSNYYGAASSGAVALGFCI